MYVNYTMYVDIYIYMYVNYIFSFQTPSLLFALQFGAFHSRLFKVPLLLSQVHEKWSKCMLKASLEAGSK